jgi:hypothetical protein
MGYRYSVSCFWSVTNSRQTEYTGDSFITALRVYMFCRRRGAQHFVLEYRP